MIFLPFKCELLVKGTVISSSNHELIREADPPARLNDNIDTISHTYKFMQDLDFSKEYKESVDTVLITFIFKIEKCKCQSSLVERGFRYFTLFLFIIIVAHKIELKMDTVIVPKALLNQEEPLTYQGPIYKCFVKQLYLSTYYSDVIIACQDEKIPAHSFVLASEL
jgi:hypothetical protein